ncbi:DNA-processing protein DprA [Xanthomonadaceae bacterium XH05]|nr:DNA-processing protein DprA [Xanthomonadaceae bacterium XH05]
MTPAFDSRDAWLRVVRSPGLGGVRIRQLLERFGSIQAVAGASGAQLKAAGVPAAAVDWLANPDRVALAGDHAWLDQSGHHLLTCDSDDFPVLLQRAPRAPAALFVDGDPQWLWFAQIAIVGSRNPTDGGIANARDFSRTLARSGLIVTSGLADGIDAAAHHAALDAGKPTIAVIATGPDIVYPARNRALAQAIAGHGAVVSEYPPGTPAQREHFPMRNRIIASLALGTLVVEAAQRSGALITAREAAEAGREVFALPGSIHNPLAKGCHRLIRDGASLVETAQEIVQALAPQAAQLATALRGRLAVETLDADAPDALSEAPEEDDDYRRLRAALGHDPVPIDVLAQRTGLTVGTLSSMLVLMELDGRVAAAHGRYALRRA